MRPERLVNLCENNKPYGRRPLNRWKDNLQSTTETEKEAVN